ncbi:MAG: type II toxin-antitoxin system RelE/ParE family toxin [Symploca sp. SIO3C6]|uniref:Type II toxin-antitoxin system RelE/ParE family toxin n=1 Tax=Symploca sp. SIO1C4 TaxID=2607765 RepID=A0A6B3NJP4_9CYAN|nr:type II toxin-antitoxin system RelE/ParE family toxin [Symploca sp. SIO3C6]NER31847.1 type II toxin-antitoxin system RelE/ParE family toxin [Symploca sp. SIO1C4]NET03527.1 type II toxin-antitoxin system RelE/ParE family toxin [Symploca sp. SIO2B6]
MGKVNKRPQVIRDLIDLAMYIAEDNLEASDLFLQAAEETFKQLAKMPQMGKMTQFSNLSLAGIRQQGIKGFRKYLVFYFPTDEGVEILRVIHGARDFEAILDEDITEGE